MRSIVMATAFGKKVDFFVEKNHGLAIKNRAVFGLGTKIGLIGVGKREEEPFVVLQGFGVAVADGRERYFVNTEVLAVVEIVAKVAEVQVAVAAGNIFPIMIMGVVQFYLLKNVSRFRVDTKKRFFKPTVVVPPPLQIGFCQATDFFQFIGQVGFENRGITRNRVQARAIIARSRGVEVCRLQIGTAGLGGSGHRAERAQKKDEQNGFHANNFEAKYALFAQGFETLPDQSPIQTPNTFSKTSHLMYRILLLALLAFALFACTRSNEPSPWPETAPSPTLVECDTCKYPVVMVHGFLAAGDTWTKFHQLFTSNGYHWKSLFAFDWNSLNQFGGGNTTQLLDQFIDNVLAETGATHVRLMGHSAGGGVCYTYLSDAARAAKVDGYVHIGSGTQPGPAGPGGSEATLNLWSPDDAVASGGDIPGATNAQIPGKDHYQIATSKESFAAVWQFFHNSPPATLDITPQGPLVCIAGKVLFFGENTPLDGAKVEVWELNPATGERVGGSPDFTFTTNAAGKWGPENVKANTTFEFVATPPNASQRVIHYFREGITHLNSLVYLRTIPPPPSLAGLLLAGLPNENGQAVLNIFSASQSVLNGRDTLWAAGSVLSTPEYASPTKTAITYFLYDDGDGVTELTPVGAFAGFTFLNGVDMFFPTTPPGSIPLVMNSRSLNVRNIPSSAGVVVGVFD